MAHRIYIAKEGNVATSKLWDKATNLGAVSVSRTDHDPEELFTDMQTAGIDSAVVQSARVKLARGENVMTDYLELTDDQIRFLRLGNPPPR